MSAGSWDIHGAFSADSVPTALFGYEILGGLARGAGSVLYYCQAPDSTEVRVLKHVVITTEKEKRFYEQLRTEFLLGRKVIHPGLRRCLEMHVSRTWRGGVNEACVIMELCDGYTLEEYFPVDPTERVCIFLRCAMAIAALNDFGWVHCDLKPGNILIHGRAEAKVIDLGQACRIGTVKHRIQGTPNFMAPEQRRREPMTPKTDVFCFGATMYAALVGKPIPTVMTAGKGESVELVDGVVPAPHTLDAYIPEELSMLVMDCVKAIPEQRPRDMHRVVERLKEAGMAVVRRLS